MRTILVLEDEPITAVAMVRSLQELGYNALLALNSHDAIRIGKEHELDLIITDIRLGSDDSITGIEASQVIGRFKGYVPFLIMSAYSTKDIDINVDGAVGFMKKPVDFNQLKKVVQIIFREI